MAYVMMGRVENMENLFIAGNFDEKKIRCIPKALEEATRLEKISLSWKVKDVCFLSVASLNIRSLMKHKEDLKVDYKMMGKDVICLQETWLHPDDDNKYSLDGYESCFASFGKGKGLATFAKPAIDDKISLIASDGTFQLMKTSIKGITVISVYLSSNCPQMENVVDFLAQQKTESCLIIGDFNFTPDASNLVTKQLRLWNFSQIVHSPTHKDGNILDHAYVSEALSNSTFSELHYVYFSDHQCLFVNIIKE